MRGSVDSLLLIMLAAWIALLSRLMTVELGKQFQQLTTVVQFHDDFENYIERPEIVGSPPIPKLPPRLDHPHVSVDRLQRLCLERGTDAE